MRVGRVVRPERHIGGVPGVEPAQLGEPGSRRVGLFPGATHRASPPATTRPDHLSRGSAAPGCSIRGPATIGRAGAGSPGPGASRRRPARRPGRPRSALPPSRPGRRSPRRAATTSSRPGPARSRGAGIRAIRRDPELTRCRNPACSDRSFTLGRSSPAKPQPARQVSSRPGGSRAASPAGSAADGTRPIGRSPAGPNSSRRTGRRCLAASTWPPRSNTSASRPAWRSPPTRDAAGSGARTRSPSTTTRPAPSAATPSHCGPPGRSRSSGSPRTRWCAAARRPGRSGRSRAEPSARSRAIVVVRSLIAITSASPDRGSRRSPSPDTSRTPRFQLRTGTA